MQLSYSNSLLFNFQKHTNRCHILRAHPTQPMCTIITFSRGRGALQELCAFEVLAEDIAATDIAERTVLDAIDSSWVNKETELALFQALP